MEKFISKKDNQVLLFGVPIYYIWLLGILFSLIGFVGENLFKLFTDGFIDSRFHLLPFIGAYVLVPFAVHIALGNPDSLILFGYKVFKIDNIKNKILSNLLCYAIICSAVFLGEFIVGNLVEILFDVKLWNYSDMAYHVTQYTCLFATFLYGTIAYVFFKFIFKPLLKLMENHISYKTSRIICLTLGVLIILDEVRLMITMMVIHEAPQFWKLVIFKK